MSKIYFRLSFAVILGIVDYLLFDNISSALFMAVVLFVGGSKSELKYWQTKNGKILASLILVAGLIGFIFFTINSEVSVLRKTIAWLLIAVVFLLERLEKYFTNQNNRLQHNEDI